MEDLLPPQDIGGGSWSVLESPRTPNTDNIASANQTSIDDNHQPIRTSWMSPALRATARKAKATHTSTSSKKSSPKVKMDTKKKALRGRRRKSSSNQLLLPLTLDGYWEIEQVLDHRVRNGVDEFLVKWKGFDEDENSWEPADNLSELAWLEAKKLKKKKKKA